MKEVHKQVYSFVTQKINTLWNAPDGIGKASMANLRKGIGHMPGELPQIWGEFLLDMPEDLYGYNGFPSRAEWAVYTVLTLYALHQQGKDIHTKKMCEKGQYFGKAVSQLVKDENDRERVWKRFNTIAMSSDMIELNHYLRGMIQLLKTEGIAIDYPNLAVDLYFFQDEEKRKNVKLKWGQDFYRKYNNLEEEN